MSISCQKSKFQMSLRVEEGKDLLSLVRGVVALKGGWNFDDTSEGSQEDSRRKIDRNLMAFRALGNKFET